MNQIDFIKQNMKRVQLKDISQYKNKPILAIYPRIIKAYKNEHVVAQFNDGYDYEWFVFKGNIPCNDDIEDLIKRIEKQN